MGVRLAGFLLRLGRAGPTLMRIILFMLLFMMLLAVIGFVLRRDGVVVLVAWWELVGGDVDDPIDDMDVRDEDEDEHDGGDEMAES